MCRTRCSLEFFRSPRSWAAERMRGMLLLPAARVLGVFLALLLGLACATGNPSEPSRACTLIGCEDGYRVDLQPASGWPTGDYRFSIEADTARVTCQASLPLPACGSGPAVSCEPRGVVTIVESGCALPATAHGFPQITFERSLRPQCVALSIVRSQ